MVAIVKCDYVEQINESPPVTIIGKYGCVHMQVGVPYMRVRAYKLMRTILFSSLSPNMWPTVAQTFGIHTNIYSLAHTPSCKLPCAFEQTLGQKRRQRT